MLALVVALVLTAVVPTHAGKFDKLTDCAACTAAGFGWSYKHKKCGGYANRKCEQEQKLAPPSPPTDAAPPSQTQPRTDPAPAATTTTTSSDPLAAAYAQDRRELDSFSVHPGSFLGDDDDMLTLMGYRRKCSAMAEVVEHYMDLPYPPRDPADEDRRVVSDPNNTPVAISHHVYNGKKVFAKLGSDEPPFRILVAGGGTGDATVMFSVAFAMARLRLEIVQVDLSQASINVAKARLKKQSENRGMKSIFESARFIRGSLLEVGSMGLGTFDYINCIGVLHHLETPSAGLAALTSVLKEDGGMNLMVYGELGRRGIYEFHDMYRLLGKQRNPDLARRLVAALPDTNWLKKNPNMMTGDMTQMGDSGVTDLLLHHCDHAYRVPELLHWLASSGLRLVEYCDKENFDTLPRGFNDRELVQSVSEMSWEQRAAFIELVKGDVYKHMFYAAKNGSASRSATEGEAKGSLSDKTVICRYDRFIGLSSGLDRDSTNRALAEPQLKITFRDEIWNVHKRLPAGITAAIMPHINCRNTVRDLYGITKKKHQFIADMSYRQFKKQVIAFYQGLATHASSRQVFLSAVPYELPRPRQHRDFRRVQFSA